MKGSFFLGADKAQKFEIREMQFGEPGAHEVLVKVMACGVCGTDVHIYKGGQGSAPVTPPVVLGHEFAGVVEKTGSAVTAVKPGDHVTLDPNMYCGICRPCRMGKKSECEHLYALGVNTNGGFAEYCMCPETQCFKLNDDVDWNAAAMAEPLACAVHGIDRAGIIPGQNVLIIGGGTIGLIMAQLAKLSGAAKVMLSEVVRTKDELAYSVGADAVIDPLAENIADAVERICGVRGADVVIECVGNIKASQQAVEAAAPGATVVFFGVPALDAKLELPMFDVYKKELTIKGSIINPDTHQRAVALINSGRIKLSPLVSHCYGLAQLEEAIIKQSQPDSVKVIVHPGE